ncbi:MAG: cell division protein FtsZ, partial [Alkalinema sp. RL_2_19]|nr:cell division protein FtsZ [Alkalinema sp. RL_2_19]
MTFSNASDPSSPQVGAEQRPEFSTERQHLSVVESSETFNGPANDDATADPGANAGYAMTPGEYEMSGEILPSSVARIKVIGVGGSGGNAVNRMISSDISGVEFWAINTDAQALTNSQAPKRLQLGQKLTRGLGAGGNPSIGQKAAEESREEIAAALEHTDLVFITAGMGGGTGTGGAPVIARAAREAGILTVGVVTKPFHFEGQRRMRTADQGIKELQEHVDTLIVIPNQNLFRIANDKTTFADAFAMADQVLYSGVACITDL